MTVLRIPQRFRAATTESLDVKQFAEVLRYGEQLSKHIREGRGLLLSGPPGAGKTWAISALTREYNILRPGKYEFVTVPTFLQNLRAGEFDGAFDEYRETSWEHTYSTIRWLVLNDLGKESHAGKTRDTAVHQLGRILRARSETMKVTHITTNLSGEQIQQIYGESITSLLSEMMVPVVVQGKDRRLGP